MRKIFNLILLFLFLVQCALAAAPQLILAASEDGWRDPVYSPDGKAIAFTNSAQSALFVLLRDENSPRTVARAEGIGRRYVFEPNGQRIVFRMRAHALPLKPERLLASSIYIYDPVHHSTNLEGDIFGPYFFNNRVWYRTALVGPFFDYENHVQASGPYWDPVSGGLTALNSKLDTVFIARPDQFIAGVEISPDGAWIAAVESQPVRQLLLIRIEDGQTQAIPSLFAPGWAGDSKHVIGVTNGAENRSQLLLVSVPSGETVTILNNPPFQPETPALDAAGKHALFVSNGAIYELGLP
jgi:Tol biopolymer transport system component